MLRRFALSRRAGAATEFALIGLWAIGLMLVILNLALLSYSLGALAHGVQAAARQAAVTAASNSTGSTTGTVTTQTFATCPDASTVAGYFTSFSNHALPAAGTTSGTSNPYIASAWNYTSGNGLGLYVTVSGVYKWRPMGFNLLNSNFITLKISTWATVPGSISSNSTYYTVTVNGTC